VAGSAAAADQALLLAQAAATHPSEGQKGAAARTCGMVHMGFLGVRFPSPKLHCSVPKAVLISYLDSASRTLGAEVLQAHEGNPVTLGWPWTTALHMKRSRPRRSPCQQRRCQISGRSR
jgi:hypothetical protein